MKNYGKIQTDKDVTTKEYVDNKNGLSQDDADARYLQLSGGTLSDGIVFDHIPYDSDPISFKITNKNNLPNYIEENGVIKFNTGSVDPDGTEWFGPANFRFNYPISMDNHKITNVSTPTGLYDVTNKKYVDDTITTVSSTASEALTKATTTQTALTNKQDKITGAANKLVGINSSGIAAVTDTFAINGPIQIGNIKIQYDSSLKALEFLFVS